MSGKRPHSPDSPLCRFSFADGRHCKMPAHPDCDGLCYTHGTLAPRASRQDNFLRELAPLSNGSPTPEDFRHAFSAISRALAHQRIEPSRAAALANIAELLRRLQRRANEDDFRSARGSVWDALRDFLDDPSLKAPQVN